MEQTIKTEHYLGEEVTAITADNKVIAGKITFIRIEIYNPGGGLKDVIKQWYTIVGNGVKAKVREYEIQKAEEPHVNKFLANQKTKLYLQKI